MKKHALRASKRKDANRVVQQLAQAKTFHSNGENAQAERLLDRLLREHPDDREILKVSGGFLKDVGRPSEAVPLLERLVELSPAEAGHWLELGGAYQDNGSLQSALLAYRQALALDPARWEAYLNIAYLLHNEKQFEQAEGFYRYALQLNADYGPAWSGLGEICLCLKRPQEAILCLSEALTSVPSADNYCNLAQALTLCRDFVPALRAAQKATELNPRHALAHSLAGFAHFQAGNFTAAKRSWEAALAVDPACTKAIVGLADVHTTWCNWEEAVSWFERALEANARYNSKVHSSLLFTLSVMPGIAPQRLFEEHERWARTYSSEASRFRHTPDAQDPARKLRIGFVSGDFRAHSVRSYIAPLLRGLDRNEFYVVCYSNGDVADSATAQLRTLADDWRDVHGQSDDELARLIRNDRVDILVDLSGHSVANRMLVFDRKPAPVQVTYLGYPNTTGLTTIDYWMTDWILHPAGTLHRTSERIWRLPRCWVTFEPPPNTPDVAERDGTEPVTFVSFATLWKLSSDSLRLWGRVMNALPESKLLLKARGLASSAERTILLDRLRSAGISADRVTLMGDLPSQAEHLAMYGKVDIALDTTPFSGGTTTAEALWMGVPVVTVPGDLMGSMMSASQLHAVGLDEFVAKNEDDYVRIALELAGNAAYRARLGRELRPRMAASPLCDGKDLANHIGAAFRQMWTEWLGSADLPAYVGASCQPQLEEATQ